MQIHSSRQKALPPLDIYINGSSTLVWYSLHTIMGQTHSPCLQARLPRGLAYFTDSRGSCLGLCAPCMVLMCFLNHVMQVQCEHRTKAQSRSLKHLQKYAARIILCRLRDASALEMGKELGWRTLASRRE